MTRLIWGEGRPTYNSGVDRGVLYLDDRVLVWEGLVSVNESATGDLNTTLYFDASRRRVAQTIGGFQGSIEAFSYPPELAPYDSVDDNKDGQQRKPFGFSYRTRKGDGYQIHILYNVMLAPSSQRLETERDSPSATNFTWDVSAIPEPMPWTRSNSHLIVDSTLVRYPEALATLEEWLYGTDDSTPRLPSPDSIEKLFEGFTTLRIVYNGDGTWTATGPDDMIEMVDARTFQITTESAFYIHERVYIIDSY